MALRSNKVLETPSAPVAASERSLAVLQRRG